MSAMPSEMIGKKARTIFVSLPPFWLTSQPTVLLSAYFSLSLWLRVFYSLSVTFSHVYPSEYYILTFVVQCKNQTREIV